MRAVHQATDGRRRACGVAHLAHRSFAVRTEPWRRRCRRLVRVRLHMHVNLKADMILPSSTCLREQTLAGQGGIGSRLACWCTCSRAWMHDVVAVRVTACVATCWCHRFCRDFDEVYPQGARVVLGVPCESGSTQVPSNYRMHIAHAMVSAPTKHCPMTPKGGERRGPAAALANMQGHSLAFFGINQKSRSFPSWRLA